MQPSRSTPHLIPRPILLLGVTLWLGLGAYVCHWEISQNDDEPTVVLVGIGITTLTTGCISIWLTMLCSLLINWLAKSRRALLRSRLFEWTASFVFFSLLAVWAFIELES